MGGGSQPACDALAETLVGVQLHAEVPQKGSENVNANFISRMLQPATARDVSEACRLIDHTDVGIYFVGASGVLPR